MANIKDINTPFGSGKITSLGTWVSIIGSVVVTIIAVAVGQNLARKAEMASGGRIDATIDPIFSQPATAPKAKPII
jgi:uncharacterized membrane protein